MLNLYPDFLTKDIIAGELMILEQLGAVHHLEAEIHSPEFVEKCHNDFEALFLCLEAVNEPFWGLETSAGDFSHGISAVANHDLEECFCGWFRPITGMAGGGRPMGGYLH